MMIQKLGLANFNGCSFTNKGGSNRLAIKQSEPGDIFFKGRGTPAGQNVPSTEFGKIDYNNLLTEQITPDTVQPRAQRLAEKLDKDIQFADGIALKDGSKLTGKIEGDLNPADSVTLSYKDGLIEEVRIGRKENEPYHNSCYGLYIEKYERKDDGTFTIKIHNGLARYGETYSHTRLSYTRTYDADNKLTYTNQRSIYREYDSEVPNISTYYRKDGTVEKIKTDNKTVHYAEDGKTVTKMEGNLVELTPKKDGSGEYFSISLKHDSHYGGEKKFADLKLPMDVDLTSEHSILGVEKDIITCELPEDKGGLSKVTISKSGFLQNDDKILKVAVENVEIIQRNS